MDINKRDALIAVGVVVGGFILFTILRSHSASSTTAAGSPTGANALTGGYATAQTVYVPTSSYNITYDTNYGTIVQGNTPAPSSGMVTTGPSTDPTPPQAVTVPGPSTVPNPTPVATPIAPPPAPSAAPTTPAPAPAPAPIATAPTVNMPKPNPNAGAYVISYSAPAATSSSASNGVTTTVQSIAPTIVSPITLPPVQVTTTVQGAANAETQTMSYAPAPAAALVSTLNPSTPKAVISAYEANPSYVVDRATTGQTVVATGANAYDTAVNNAGGMWLNGHHVSGTYNAAGQFVASNAASARLYNSYEQSRGNTARATVA